MKSDLIFAQNKDFLFSENDDSFFNQKDDSFFVADEPPPKHSFGGTTAAVSAGRVATAREDEGSHGRFLQVPLRRRASYDDLLRLSVGAERAEIRDPSAEQGREDCGLEVHKISPSFFAAYSGTVHQQPPLPRGSSSSSSRGRRSSLRGDRGAPRAPAA
jgi:hypothetical protein